LKNFKMIEERRLPKEYKALEKLNICSNTIIGGGKIIGVNDFAPILIGDGNIPNIWLYGKNNENKWVAIVEQNLSFHPAINIKRDLVKKRITIKIQSKTILNARMTSKSECKVIAINLKPIGLNIVGNTNELKVGESSFSDNTYQGKGYMIGFTE